MARKSARQVSRSPGRSIKKTKATRVVKKTAPKKTAAKTAQSPRSTFKVTGDESVLNFITRKGGHATTAQVIAHWEKDGRRGNSGNALTHLVKQGKLKREDVGRYRLARRRS